MNISTEPPLVRLRQSDKRAACHVMIAMQRIGSPTSPDLLRCSLGDHSELTALETATSCDTHLQPSADRFGPIASLAMRLHGRVDRYAVSSLPLPRVLANPRSMPHCLSLARLSTTHRRMEHGRHICAPEIGSEPNGYPGPRTYTARFEDQDDGTFFFHVAHASSDRTPGCTLLRRIVQLGVPC